MSATESHGHRFALDHDPDGSPFVWYACPHFTRYATDEAYDAGGLARLPRGLRGWNVVTELPLTVAPSLASQGCGCHGWIRNGKWVDA